MKKIPPLLLMIFVINSCEDNKNYNQHLKQNRQFSNLEKTYKKPLSKGKIEFINSMRPNANFNDNDYQNDFGDDYDSYDQNPDFSDEGQDLNDNKDGDKNWQKTSNNFEEIGVASWYGKHFNGKKTANGEIYNANDMTAAHPTLPLPSIVIVTNLDNGKSVKVRVNDRGPSAKDRIIDVSEKAAIELGFKEKGMTNVEIKLANNQKLQ